MRKMFVILIGLLVGETWRWNDEPEANGVEEV